MENQDLEQKRALARKAMGGDTHHEKKRARQLELEQKRAQAMEAMMSPEYKERQAKLEEELAKKREQAKRAMESSEQKIAREREEERLQNERKVKEKLEELKAKQQAEEANKAKLAKEKQQAETEQKTERQKQYLAHLEATNALIDKITAQEEAEVQPYRTLRQDANRTVAKEKMSMTDIALKQKQKDLNTTKPKPQSGRPIIKKVITIGLIICFLTAGMMALYLISKALNNQDPNPAGITQSIVPAHRQVKIDATGRPPAQTITAIRQIANQDGITDSVTNIYITEKKLIEKTEQEVLVVTRDLLNILNINTPIDFNHFLDDQHMIGVYHHETNMPFIILKTTSFESTFDALLADEANIVGSWLQIFKPELKTRLAGRIFTDKIIKNLDIRSALDPISGETIAAYAFLDRNTIIFTEYETVINKIVSVLQTTNTAPIAP